MHYEVEIKVRMVVLFGGKTKKYEVNNVDALFYGKYYCLR